MDSLKKLVNDIDKLSIECHIEIFKIIKDSTTKYTINPNGVFINLSDLDENIITQIKNFVEYCINIDITNDVANKILADNVSIYDTSSNTMPNTTLSQITPIIENHESDQSKNDNISLKRSKLKYTGNKARIIKNYKKNDKKN